MIISKYSRIPDDKIILLVTVARRGSFNSPDLQCEFVKEKLDVTKTVISEIDHTMLLHAGNSNKPVNHPSIDFKDLELRNSLAFIRCHLEELQPMPFMDLLTVIQIENEMLERLSNKPESEIKRTIGDRKYRDELLGEIFRIERYNYLGREQAFRTLQSRATEALGTLNVLKKNSERRQVASDKLERNYYKSPDEKAVMRNHVNQLITDTFDSDDIANEALEIIDIPALYEDIDPEKFDPKLAQLIDSHKNWFISFNNAVLAA